MAAFRAEYEAWKRGGGFKRNPGGVSRCEISVFLGEQQNSPFPCSPV
jgi:hypothetical protein